MIVPAPQQAFLAIIRKAQRQRIGIQVPESLKTIREFTVKYQTEGVQKFEADFQRASVAQDQGSRSGLSAEKALARQAAALDVTAKAAQYTSAQFAVLNRGLQ